MLFLTLIGSGADTVETDSAFSASHLVKINICDFTNEAYVLSKETNMFIAQMLLCSSIVGGCIGVKDQAGLVSDVKACEKRIEEMVSDAREIMPRFFVVHVECKPINGFAV